MLTKGPPATYPERVQRERLESWARSRGLPRPRALGEAYRTTPFPG